MHINIYQCVLSNTIIEIYLNTKIIMLLIKTMIMTNVTPFINDIADYCDIDNSEENLNNDNYEKWQ